VAAQRHLRERRRVTHLRRQEPALQRANLAANAQIARSAEKGTAHVERQGHAAETRVGSHAPRVSPVDAAERSKELHGSLHSFMRSNDWGTAARIAPPSPSFVCAR
jgi:hypothetical protein